jgi:glycosyltransferase involved in cell wall biosynthesis
MLQPIPDYLDKRVIIMIPISAVIITKNEELNIVRTVKSLDFCDEIIIVDSGSTDTTVALCKNLGCTVFFREFDMYGLQKQYAVALAKNDWVLAIDADELVTPKLKQEIIQLFSEPMPDVAGFNLPRSLVFLGHTFRFSGQHKRPYLRFFNKQYGTFNNKSIHEGVEINGVIKPLHNILLHYSYKSISDYLVKFNKYTTLAGQAIYKEGKKKSRISCMFRFPTTFIKIYLIKGGFLDGYAGFIWALLSSVYPVIKYAKADELFTNATQTH